MPAAVRSRHPLSGARGRGRTTPRRALSAEERTLAHVRCLLDTGAALAPGEYELVRQALRGRVLSLDAVLWRWGTWPAFLRAARAFRSPSGT